MISALNFKIGGGGACADATVKNSDNTYSTTAASGSTLTLPDITVTDSDGTTSSVAAVKNVTCKLAPVGQTLMKTGQTTSYRTGDDGDIEAGRLTSFSVLPSNNPFGNTNRFTSELGTQTYTNNIVIDWSTYNGSTVLGYKRTYQSNALWSASIDGCLAVSIGTYTSGWRMWNILEFINICNFSQADSNPFPATFTTPNTYLWTSNTNNTDTTQAYMVALESMITYRRLVKTSASIPTVAVRNFTVTGTTLT